jgi:predicted GNAT family acetyltransferase
MGVVRIEFMRHETIESFLYEAQKQLEDNEALNNLILGLCFRIRKNPDYYGEIYLATVKDRGEIILACLMTIPEKINLYSTRSDVDEALIMLIEDLEKRNIALPGVIGPRPLVEKAVKIIEAHGDLKFVRDVNMRVYKLEVVNSSLIGEGKLRAATEKDLGFVSEAIYQFDIDARIDLKPDRNICMEAADKRIKLGEVFLWELEGKIVSMAGKTRPTNNGITVSLVYTPAELRGKGYASSCVAALSQSLLESGHMFCTLFTDLANPVSNSIYMKIGYEPIGDFDSYLVVNN